MAQLNIMPLREEYSRLYQVDLVSWIFGNEDYDRNRKIYIDPDHPTRSLTVNEARCLVRKLVSGFKAKGLQRGDCVCLHAFNDIMYTMLFLGILGAGGRFTGSNPAYTSIELSHHMRTTETRFLISEPELLPRIAPAIEECSLTVSNVFVFDPTGCDFPLYYHSWKDLLNCGESDWVRFKSDDDARNTTAALLSTSGTTGLPKAAMISHYNCVIQNIMLDDSRSKTYKVSRIITLPEFHAFAFPIAHVAPLREGITTYIMRRFDLQRYLSAIQQYEITETPMVPQMLRTIVEQSSLARKMLKSLQLVWSAGAPLTESLQGQFYRLLKPAARVTQVWGMTEAGWISTFLWPEKDHSGSVGRLLPAMEAKLVHDDGYEIETDEISAEIFVRGPSVMQGYLGNADASRNAIDQEGWLRTGDIAYKHQGRLYIVDRKKEMLKVRGWQVSPAELEAALLLHPNITDAAVVGIHPRLSDDTELPRAYVVKLADSSLSEREIKHFMASRLARYKSLDGGVAFVDTIPRNSAGKVQRGILRDRAAAEACEIDDKCGKFLSASKTPNARHLLEGGMISLDSSVISYDGTNETGMQSRRSSASTVGTVYSEATGWISKCARTAASTKDDTANHGKPLKGQAIVDAPSEYNGAGEARLHIENAFAERATLDSDAVASRGMPDSPDCELAGSRAVHVSMDAPTSTGRASFLPDTTASVPNQPALSDLKKRAAENVEELDPSMKKPNTYSKVDRSTAHAEETYRRAMAIVVKERSIALD